MKNFSTIFILIIIMSFIIIGGCKKNELDKKVEKVEKENITINIIGEENVMIKEWKYGFGLDEQGKPICYNPLKYGYNGFYRHIKKETINNGEIIQAAIITILSFMINITDGEGNSEFGIGFMQSYKDGALRELKHKILNNINYVSADGVSWERLEIKYLRETEEKNPYGEPLVLTYFKCSYFEGEYYIVFRL